jgi:BirA family transcriptional regulator, biotin operon repressor / biotin---[acetyl-CoA-carboxylase] ligase
VANASWEFFSKYAGDETRIKWPNDIYWRDRKAGGILIENIIRGNNWLWALVGIGMNINQTAFTDLPNPVSLKQITGKSYDSVELGMELCSYLDRHYRLYLAEGETSAFRFYNERLYKAGEMVHFRKGAESFPCTVEGVALNGDLRVSGCSYERFSFGEVEWLR